MKKKKWKIFCATVCCLSVVSSAAVFCLDQLTVKEVKNEIAILADEPIVDITQQLEQAASKQTEAEAASATEPEAAVEPTAPVYQEIDGLNVAVHATLPVNQPSVSPAEATDVSIVVEKSKHLLTLYSADTVIAQYSVGVGSVAGAKEMMDDKRTPEGEYSVCVLNEYSKYYLALGLNYPNANDAARGLSSGLITQQEYDDIMAELAAGQQPDWYTKLGGQIMIHGQKGNLGGQADWTTGCVGTDNTVMDILWQYCQVGTKVTIKP